MGIWSPALYGSDLAEDLKASIKAVARLPHESERLVDLVCRSNPDIWDQPGDEQYTTFWLVLADQFHKRGLAPHGLLQRAIEIIDSGIDLQTLSQLGMSASDLGKRKKMLEGLRTKLESPQRQPESNRLKAPEPWLMRPGDVMVFPVDQRGLATNPYLSKSMQTDWKQAGWGAMIVVECGRAFDYLAWYRPLKLIGPVEIGDNPALIPNCQQVVALKSWSIENAGTCKPGHFKKIGLRQIGNIHLVAEKIQKVVATLMSGDQFAINDIGLSDSLLPSWSKSRCIELSELCS